MNPCELNRIFDYILPFVGYNVTNYVETTGGRFMESTYITAIHIKHVRYLREIQIPISANTRKNLILTESSKSPASSAWSAKRWVGDLLVSGGVQTPPDKPRSGYEVMSK